MTTTPIRNGGEVTAPHTVVHLADTHRYQTALGELVGHWAMYALLSVVLGVGIGTSFTEPTRPYLTDTLDEVHQ